MADPEWLQLSGNASEVACAVMKQGSQDVVISMWIEKEAFKYQRLRFN